MLTNLQPRDVLFVDEIHRLSPVVEEVLYPAMEDYQLDIMIGEGPAARSIKLNLPPFTLVGATTRAGLLTSPLRDRFGIVQRLEFYDVADLERIVQALGGASSACPIDDGRRTAHRAALARHAAHRQPPAAPRARLRPGEGRRRGSTSASRDAALDLLEVDPLGFDTLDRKLLLTIIEKFDGGPVGIDSLAAAIGEERGTLEDVIEPFLIQQGFLVRTARGRIATRAAYLHFGLKAPERAAANLPLFEDDAVSASPGRRASTGRTPTAVAIVYYANYLRFLERARTEWLRSLRPLAADAGAASPGILFAVAGLTIDTAGRHGSMTSC